MTDIKKLALLARINLTEKEEGKFKKEFEDILGYVSKLKEVEEIDASGMNEIKAGRVIDTENETREDDHPYKAEEFSKDLLKEAPSVDKGCIRVKHILG